MTKKKVKRPVQVIGRKITHIKLTKVKPSKVKPVVVKMVKKRGR